MTDDNKSLVLKKDEQFSRALEPTNWESAMECGAMIAKSGIGGVKTPEEAMIRIMAGREIGLGAMASLRLIYSVNGKVGYDAALIRARCLQHPECKYFEPVEISDTKAIFRAKRGDRPEQTYEFTIEQARAAKLADKDVWKFYPRNLLSARATVNLARLVFPEVAAGMYTADELSGPYVGNAAADPTPPAVIEAVFESTAVTATTNDFEDLINDASSIQELEAVASRINEARKSGKVSVDLAKKLGASYKAKAGQLAESSKQT